MSASSLKITPFRAISNTLLHIFVVYLFIISLTQNLYYAKNKYCKSLTLLLNVIYNIIALYY